MATSWSTTRKGSGVSLSLSNTKFTLGTGGQSVFNTDMKLGGGRYYVEFLVDVDAGGSTNVGLATSAWAASGAPGASGTDSIGISCDGNLWFNGASTAIPSGAGGAGDRYCLDIDLDGRTVRARKNNGSWSSTVAITDICAGGVHLVGFGYTAGDAGTLKTASTDWSFSSPGGVEWTPNTGILVVQQKQPTIKTGAGGAGTGAFAGAAADITFPLATTTGNTIVVLLPFYASGGLGAATAGVTDNKGNTFTRAGRASRPSGTDYGEVWYCTNATGGSTHTVSVTALTGSIGSLYGEIVIYELSGVDPSNPVSVVTAGGDASALPSNSGSLTWAGGTAQITLPSTTPGDANCFWAVVVPAGGAPGFNGTPPGYITGLSNSYYSDYATSNNALWGAGLIAGSAAQSFLASGGNGNTSTDAAGYLIVAFKPAWSGGIQGVGAVGSAAPLRGAGATIYAFQPDAFTFSYPNTGGGGGSDASPAVIGVAGTGAAGTVGKTVADTGTGVPGTGSAGTVSIAVSDQPLGVSVTGSAGTARVAISVTGLGVSATGTAGTATGSTASDASPAPLGVAGTGASGTVTPSVAKTLTGVAATGTAGSAADTVADTAPGVQATGTAGGVTPSVAVTAAGVAATGTAGLEVTSLFAGPAGVQATGSAGTVSAGNSVNVAVTGVAATSAAGTATVALSGFGLGASATGTAGNTAGALADSVAGVSASGQAGVPSVKVDAASGLGVASTGSAGAVTPSVAVTAPGVQATGTAGTPTAGAATTQSVTGVAATSAAGTVSIVITVGGIGVQASGAAGAVADQLQGATSGAGATGSAGALVPSVTVLLVGVGATGTAGAVTSGSSAANVPVTGVVATGGAGTVGISIDQPAKPGGGGGKKGGRGEVRKRLPDRLELQVPREGLPEVYQRLGPAVLTRLEVRELSTREKLLGSTAAALERRARAAAIEAPVSKVLREIASRPRDAKPVASHEPAPGESQDADLQERNAKAITAIADIVELLPMLQALGLLTEALHDT